MKDVLIITGASSGIGLATAKRMSSDYNLVLVGRSIDPLEKVVADLGGEENAIAVSCDVSREDHLESMVKKSLDHFGQIDAVFANAGCGAELGFLEGDIEQWEQVVQTNVLGTALTIRTTLPHMLERGSGHYLITGSVVGRQAIPGSIYSASKFAVHGLHEGLRLELKTHKKNQIRATLIEPGMVKTDFFNRAKVDIDIDGGLNSDSVAKAVEFALSQPAEVDISDVVVRPTMNEL